MNALEMLEETLLSAVGGEEIECGRGKANVLLKPLSAGAFLSTHEEARLQLVLYNNSCFPGFVS